MQRLAGDRVFERIFLPIANSTSWRTEAKASQGGTTENERKYPVSGDRFDDALRIIVDLNWTDEPAELFGQQEVFSVIHRAVDNSRNRLAQGFFQYRQKFLLGTDSVPFCAE
jgi:hypothetical protein